MSDPYMVTAFAPASIGNVGVGFDMLGLALAGVGDRVTAQRTGEPGVRIAEVRGVDGDIHPYLSTETDHNTASIAAQALWLAQGDSTGVELRIQKGVPLQSGMGSSAASAVAAAVATNALLPEPLGHEELLPFALEGEAYASGGAHADNVAPSLMGGLVLCPTVLLPRLVQLNTPSGVSSVLIHPELRINTAHARRSLAGDYTLDQWLSQQGYLAGFIAACAADDHELIRQSLHDVIIEPRRAEAVACFDAVKEAALAAGALGASISGSGPSIFALSAESNASNVATAMEQACHTFGLECQSWVSPMTAPGAHVEDRQ
ncbi:MAG: homoserine kinase [Woeseia sp.]